MICPIEKIKGVACRICIHHESHERSKRCFVDKGYYCPGCVEEEEERIENKDW